MKNSQGEHTEDDKENAGENLKETLAFAAVTGEKGQKGSQLATRKAGSGTLKAEKDDKADGESQAGNRHLADICPQLVDSDPGNKG